MHWALRDTRIGAWPTHTYPPSPAPSPLPLTPTSPARLPLAYPASDTESPVRGYPLGGIELALTMMLTRTRPSDYYGHMTYSAAAIATSDAARFYREVAKWDSLMPWWEDAQQDREQRVDVSEDHIPTHTPQEWADLQAIFDWEVFEGFGK